ncbi:MAG: hypothetical protein ACRD0S_12215 [Acidimicrobiales bacterium]
MTPLALAPAAVFLAGLVAVIAMVARLIEEAGQLRSSLRRTGELRPLVVEVVDEARRLQAGLARHHDR